MARRFIKLSSGGIFPLDKLIAIARKELNQYYVFVEGLGQTALNADGNDYDQLVKEFGDDLAVFEAPPKEASIKTKLDIVD